MLLRCLDHDRSIQAFDLSDDGREERFALVCSQIIRRRPPSEQVPIGERYELDAKDDDKPLDMFQVHVADGWKEFIDACGGVPHGMFALTTND